MEQAQLWRTSFEDASLAGVFEDGLEEKAISKDELAALKADIMKGMPEGIPIEGMPIGDALKQHVQQLNPDIFGPEADVGETLEKGRADKGVYQKALADQLKTLACYGDESVPYIMRGVAVRSGDSGPLASGLIEGILSPDCPASAALTAAEKAALRTLGSRKQAIIH